MTIYAVFDREATGAPAVIPDRFSWLAFLLPPVFALVHGLWLELLVYAAAVMLLGTATAAIGLATACWIYGAFALWIGFEASAMRRAALQRAGWHFRTDVVASAADLAQLEGLKGRRP